ncbi:CmcJ/NvfI family oxidoreductase [Streptomyces sp. A30]|uniref:CmcJ/NvfI family oxidoreductase n=1 Tax=Streptomyces sp. A30 TaxID=2789273 RepID=UPI00398096C5
MTVTSHDATGGVGSSVSAPLQYLAPGSHQNRLYIAPGEHLTTTAYESRVVPIANGRPHRDEFQLDRNGFVLTDHHSSVSDFRDADQIERIYAGEATDLVQRLTGADHVVCLGWVLRSAGADKKGAQPTAPDVHVDVHPDRAPLRAARIHAEKGLPGRSFRRALFTSLWRTFSTPPQDWPLAVCDYRSTDDAEGKPNYMFNVDALPDPVPDVVDEQQAITAATVFPFNPDHRWWYFPDMTADEALLFKLHDSDHTVAWRTPHTAFRDSGVSAAHPRESVELRTMAYFY